MQRGEWLARLLRCYHATVRILRRVHDEAGYPFKDVVNVDLADYQPQPTWLDGRIEIGYNNEPESLAHEMAHGLHERIREKGWRDSFGEEFAEAVRYYVECDMQTNSSWLQSFAKNTNPFTSAYTLDQFVAALKSGDLFTKVGWK